MFGARHERENKSQMVCEFLISWNEIGEKLELLLKLFLNESFELSRNEAELRLALSSTMDRSCQYIHCSFNRISDSNV